MKKDYQIIDSRTASDGFFKMKRLELRHTSYQGDWCPTVVRERIEDISAAAVLLYDPDQDAVVLVEQFRCGMMGVQDPPWCLEIVAGFCDKAHESPEDVARREVVEETGCEALDMRPIGSFFVSPGFSVEQIFLYVARVDSTRAAGIHGLAHEGEEIRVEVLSREEALAELFGRLNSTSALIALQWLDRNRARLLSDWGIS